VNRVRKLEGHTDTVLCLQFDSKRVATGSSDRSIRLWDIRSGRCFHTLFGHQGGVRCIRFDDKYIVSGSWDTTVMVWDVINFHLITTIVEHTDCISALEITHKHLITASHDTHICVFAKHTWTLLKRLLQHTAPVSSLCLVSATQFLSGSHDKLLFLWEMEELTLQQRFEGLKSPCVCVNVCGSLIAAGSTDGSIMFWDVTTGDVQACIAAHNTTVNGLCFVGSRFYTCGDEVIKEWDLMTCACLRSLRGHSDTVYCIRASSKRVVSGSGDGSARIWDMASKLQQVGRNYDELNKNIIPTQVLNEHQYKKLAKSTANT